MTDEMFFNLTNAHFKVLLELGILKHIIANKEREIELGIFISTTKINKARLHCCTYF